MDVITYQSTKQSRPLPSDIIDCEHILYECIVLQAQN